MRGRDAGDCLTRETGFELIRHMAAAEDTSWEYTSGRIDERTENLEKRIVAGFLAGMIALK